MDPRKPQTEHLLSIDPFNKPKTKSGVDADALQVATLFMMKKGSNPLYPDMGFDIASYRYKDIEGSIVQIKTQFSIHCSTYLPHIQLDDIVIQRTGDKSILFGLSVINTYEQKKSNIIFKVVEEKHYYTMSDLQVL